MTLVRTHHGYPAFYNVVERLMNQPEWAEHQKETVLSNVKKSETAYELELAVPGYTRENISLSIENKTLTVKGQVEKKEEETIYTRREFGINSFTRKFSLPENIDLQKVEAKAENGILHITLPLLEEVKPKKFEIKVA